MEKMTPNKAEILGLLCSEGCYVDTWSKYVVFDKRRSNAYYRCAKRRVVEFSNKNQNLLKRFQKLINFEYGYIPKVYVSGKCTPKIILARKAVVEDLVSYSSFGCERWVVPECILNGSESVKTRFIRGFFDGDGTYSMNRIVLYSANRDGLHSIYEMLKDLSISSSFYGPQKRQNKKDMYSIYVKASSRERFIGLMKPIKICVPT